MKQLDDKTLPHQVKRLQELRDAVGVEIHRVEAKPGDLLIAQPKDDTVRFSKQYCEWFMECLQNLPGNVRVIILAERDTTLRAASPSESGEEYMRGWGDAINSICGVKLP